jgi:hypothetical protein
MAANAKHCSDCETGFDRRSFLKSAGGTAAAIAAGSLLTDTSRLFAAPSPSSAAETAAKELYDSLTPEQRGKICFPFDHELRKRISANWHITEPLIGSDFYTKKQQAIIDQVLKGATSEDGYQKLLQQTEYDDGGVQAYSVALFGKPGEKFEFELTGRHLTLRADGNSVDRAAFGGPIVYGHGDEEAKTNLYHYQTKQTNEVFKALDEKQRQVALVKNAPKEADVQIQGAGKSYPGISVGDLSGDQQKLVSDTLKVLLAPYRQEDIDEVMEIVQSAGGTKALHMAFYQQNDLDSDKVWDIWRVEGPAFVWHFRGAPHVHAYINIGTVKAKS